MGLRHAAVAAVALALLSLVCMNSAGASATAGSASLEAFPRPLSSYSAPANASLFEVLALRARAEPFNVVATGLFFLAIVHTFFASSFTRLAHRFKHAHELKLESRRDGRTAIMPPGKAIVSFRAQIFHFLGEVEVIFGLWVVPLLWLLALSKGWPAAKYYFNDYLNFTEPLFVVVIMTIAASRPVVRLAEQVMAGFASLGRGSPAAWWISILTVGPVLGSLITEPAAMTISALLLGGKFFEHRPSPTLAYATLGLLFVNISVGGTLTHFAAPPVLMVANRWGWGTGHMLTHFGWKALVGIAVATVLCYLRFRRELIQMAASPAPTIASDGHAIPARVTVVHVLFLAWTVLISHAPALFIGGFLFYLAFTEATEHHQEEVRLRPALLVGFFLAGLVIHGGLQGWWIEPLLTRLGDLPLFFGAVGLTAFNDNAAITYLASLVPGFSPAMKYAVLAGAVVGGGLTVIANAPNPAGQSILSRYFPNGISAGGLLLGALLPTVVMALAFLLL